MTPSSIPAPAASSTTYWIIGRSTSASSSFGIAFVAGRMRVPRPAAGITALRTGTGATVPELDARNSGCGRRCERAVAAEVVGGPPRASSRVVERRVGQHVAGADQAVHADLEAETDRPRMTVGPRRRLVVGRARHAPPAPKPVRQPDPLPHPPHLP